MSERDEFEEWAGALPREFDTGRWSETDDKAPWPGSYIFYYAQCAWEAWQAARAPLLERIRYLEQEYDEWKHAHAGACAEMDRLRAQVERLEARNTELRSANGFAELESKLGEFKTKCALLAASWKKAEDRVAELDGTVKAMVEWLEADEPSVFRRGLWDAIRAAQPKTSR
jgi:hypothetical protein